MVRGVPDPADPSLIKDASKRPTYAQLLDHPFLKHAADEKVDMAGWVAHAMERQAKRGVNALAPVNS